MCNPSLALLSVHELVWSGHLEVEMYRFTRTKNICTLLTIQFDKGGGYKRVWGRHPLADCLGGGERCAMSFFPFRSYRF